MLLFSCFFFVTSWMVTHQSPLSSTISQSLVKFMSSDLMMLTISSSAALFSFSLQSFPASGSFQMSWFLSGGQTIGTSASASVFPMNIWDWFPLGLTGLISLLSKGLSSLLQHHNSKELILWHSAFCIVQLSHPYMTTEKTIALIRQTFVSKVMSLLYNMLGWS